MEAEAVVVMEAAAAAEVVVANMKPLMFLFQNL